MTGRRAERKPEVALQRKPEITPDAQRSHRTVEPGRLMRSLEVTGDHLYPASMLEVQPQPVNPLELQARHLEHLNAARAAQTHWRASTQKSALAQHGLRTLAQAARSAGQARESFVAQRKSELLDGLLEQRLESTLRPELPAVQQQSQLTLPHVADHMAAKAQAQVAGDPFRLSNYAAFKNAGATLVKQFRSANSSHSIEELASAIGRFRDPGQRGAVESAAFAALGQHPRFPGLLQRALDAQDEHLDAQRQVWQRELEPVAQRAAQLEASGEGAAGRIAAARGGGQSLPAPVRSMLEAKWNTSLGGVRVHTGSQADALSKQLNAKAFTSGSDIFFKSGSWNPSSLEGLRLIAHEAWHTVQQAQARVSGRGVDPDASLEREAELQGNTMSHSDLVHDSSQSHLPLQGATAPVMHSSLGALQRQAETTPQTTTQTQTPAPANPQTATPDVDAALAALAGRLVALVPEDFQDNAAQTIPMILRQCKQSNITNPNQVAYILATAQHEARFGKAKYSRSEPLVEDHNPLKTERHTTTKLVRGKPVKTTTVEEYRVNHVTGHRIPGADLNPYYDDAYGGRLGNVSGTSDAADFRGRGFVQLTGRDNYAHMSQQLTSENFQYTLDGVTYGTPEHPIDLIANPTHVNRVPELASRIMVSGMSQGSFTTRPMSSYINDQGTDFFNARSTVNGDKNKVEDGRTQSNGQIIAGYAQTFAAELNANNAWANLFAPAAQTPAASAPNTPPQTPRH